jgi:uncharacterized protein
MATLASAGKLNFVAYHLLAVWSIDVLQNIVTASPRDIELEPSPFPSEWVLEGHPEARAKEIARSRDRTMNVVVWSCTRGRFRWRYLVDEMVHVLSGEVFIVDHTNTERRLGPGDTAFFPAGSSSVWRVTQDVRKVAVCRHEMPMLVSLALRIWKRAARVVQPLLEQIGAARGANAGSAGALLVPGASTNVPTS